MLVPNQYIIIKWTRNNKNYYTEKGYKFTNLGDEFEVRAEDLSTGSNMRVNVECDYCHSIINLAFKCYLKSPSTKIGVYTCKHCKMKKVSASGLEKRRTSLYNRAVSFCETKGYKLITDREKISGSNSIVTCICPKHGSFNVKIYALIEEHGCKKCQYESNSNKHRKAVDELSEIFEQYDGILLNKEDYISWNTKNLQVICPECGRTFLTSFGAFKKSKGQRCSVCSRGESKGELQIRKYLESNGITFTQEKTFDNCKDKNKLRFDFYLPDYNMCIEYDGAQHFIPVSFGGSSNGNISYLKTLKHDTMKNEYCLRNNIRLLRIPYWDFDNIQKLIAENLYLHKDIV